MFDAIAATVEKDQKELLEMRALLQSCGDPDKATAIKNQKTLAAALTTPLRQGTLTGDIVSDIFATENLPPGVQPEYPIDLFRNDNANQFVAYTIPNQGKIPQRHVEGDYITVRTYDVGAGIDTLMKYVRDARWNVVARMMEVLEAGITKKNNDDGWHTILAAAVDRNIMVSDSNATAGQFTKRLVSLMKLTMLRNGSGNSTSIGKSRLTHLFLSPEAVEDMRDWGTNEVDYLTQREIFLADDGIFSKIYGVNLVSIHELGDDQEYQTYFESTLGGSMGAGDLEIVVGLDLSVKDSFVKPVREPVTVYDRPSLFEERRVGWYLHGEHGWGCLNTGRTLAGSL